MSVSRQGVPLVISAPSGGGKTTLCHRAIERLAGLQFSVSHTTRAARAGERDGVDYYFVDDAAFADMVDSGAFLEWAHVHGRRYGTRRREAQAALAAGTDVLFDIDVQGGRQIQERLPGAVLVFVVPPSMDVLAARLRARRNTADDEIERRLAAARQEMQAAQFYTHWIVNDDLERAADDLQAIVRAERLRRVDRTALLARLLGG